MPASISTSIAAARPGRLGDHGGRRRVADEVHVAALGDRRRQLGELGRGRAGSGRGGPAAASVAASSARAPPARARVVGVLRQPHRLDHAGVGAAVLDDQLDELARAARCARPRDDLHLGPVGGVALARRASGSRPSRPSRRRRPRRSPRARRRPARARRRRAARAARRAAARAARRRPTTCAAEHVLAADPTVSGRVGFAGRSALPYRGQARRFPREGRWRQSKSRRTTLHPARRQGEGHRSRPVHGRPEPDRPAPREVQVRRRTRTRGSRASTRRKAKALPGVFAVLTHEDVPDVRYGGMVPGPAACSRRTSCGSRPTSSRASPR